MQRRRPSTFAEAALGLALAVACGVAAPRAARAQVCCVGTGLVTPARLRAYESRAFGTQLRARSVLGSFGDGGAYRAQADGTRELAFEQSLVAALRLGARFQVAAQLPFVGTHRKLGGQSGWGGGVGDFAVSSRWDVAAAGAHGAWPGVAVLAGLAVPTGTPADEASDALGTSATGTGSFEGTVGLAVETVVGRAFVSLTAAAAQRTARSAGGVRQSFAPLFTGLLAGGYTFSGDLTLGAYAVAFYRGDGRDQDGVLPGSSLALVTMGAAIALPVGDSSRLQAAIADDLPIGGLGRNQGAGVSGSAAWIFYWL